MEIDVEKLLESADELIYSDYCRLITILYWNL